MTAKERVTNTCIRMSSQWRCVLEIADRTKRNCIAVYISVKKESALVCLAPKGTLRATPQSTNGHPTAPILCQNRTSRNSDNE